MPAWKQQIQIIEQQCHSVTQLLKTLKRIVKMCFDFVIRTVFISLLNFLYYAHNLENKAGGTVVLMDFKCILNSINDAYTGHSEGRTIMTAMLQGCFKSKSRNKYFKGPFGINIFIWFSSWTFHSKDSLHCIRTSQSGPFDINLLKVCHV